MNDRPGDTYRSLNRKLGFFQLITAVFLLAGLMISVNMVAKIWDHGIWQTTLREPLQIVYLLIPLLPAFVLSYIAGRIEKKMQKIVSKASENSAATKK